MCVRPRMPLRSIRSLLNLTVGTPSALQDTGRSTPIAGAATTAAALDISRLQTPSTLENYSPTIAGTYIVIIVIMDDIPKYTNDQVRLIYQRIDLEDDWRFGDGSNLDHRLRLQATHLKVLQTAFLANVPCESINMVSSHRQARVLDHETAWQKIVGGHTDGSGSCRGGTRRQYIEFLFGKIEVLTAFLVELNLLMLVFLNSIGFKVKPNFVRFLGHAEHIVVIVSIRLQRYLVDVGLG